jgi:hypothetical protein
MKYTIKDLSEGKCAIINDGTAEQLQKDFLEEEWQPKFGERVLVRDDDKEKWQEKTFLIKVPQSISPFSCVQKIYEESFKNGEKVQFSNWKQIKKLEQVEITLDDIAEKFNLPKE